MLWAYEELGWGGYWGWDPVENAGLLPWFTATAFLHSVMVQERRGMLRVWNVTLVIVTFFLTIFGTFMTRSGVVQSVHAFGEDPCAGAPLHRASWCSSSFSFGWVIYRLPLLRVAPRARLVGVARSGVPREQLDPAVLGVLRAVRDDVPDAERGGHAASGSPSVRRSSTSGCCRSGLMLLAADRHRAAARVAQVDAVEPARSSSPGPVAFDRWSTAARCVALGVRVWASGLCFALCAFVGGDARCRSSRAARRCGAARRAPTS